MPGAVEEGGKIATSIIDVLKQEPISLALVIMNLALLGMFFYVGSKSAETRAREVSMIYENEKRTSELLAKCVDPGTLREILDQFKGIKSGLHELDKTFDNPLKGDAVPNPG